MKEKEKMSNKYKRVRPSDFHLIGVQGGGSITFSSSESKRNMMGVSGPDDEAMEAALGLGGLGELADLTVSNEADPLTYDVSLVYVWILHVTVFM